jgi:hypothetical protein
MQNFAQNDITVRTARVRIQGYRLEDAVGTLTLRLHGPTAVETPIRHIGKGRRVFELLDQRLATHAGNRLPAVQPDVFQLYLVIRRVRSFLSEFFGFGQLVVHRCSRCRPYGNATTASAHAGETLLVKQRPRDGKTCPDRMYLWISFKKSVSPFGGVRHRGGLVTVAVHPL